MRIRIRGRDSYIFRKNFDGGGTELGQLKRSVSRRRRPEIESWRFRPDPWRHSIFRRGGFQKKRGKKLEVV